MRMKTVLVCFCALLMAFGLWAQSGKPKMVVVQNIYYAGEVYRTGKNIEHAFVIKNQGTAELKILEVSPG